MRAAQRALGESFDRRGSDGRCARLSGGEQKRLALEALLRGPDDVLLLDEPDNFLDVPGKRWLEAELSSTPKTILFVSHDRELLAATATKIVTVEAVGAWTHGGGFAGYARCPRRHHLETIASTIVRSTTTSEEASRGARRRDAAPGQASPRPSPRG